MAVAMDKLYIITDKKYGEGFIHYYFNEKLWISAGKNVRVHFNSSNNIALIGIAWSVLDGETPYEQIDSIAIDCDKDVVIDKISFWCGKFTLLIGNTIYTDAFCMQGCFYSQYAVSNHFGLLSRYLDLQIKYPKNVYGAMCIDFFPGPDTTAMEIKRLMSSQIFTFGKGVEQRRLLTDHENEDSNIDIEKRFIHAFTNSLKNMRKALEGEFYVALTGGHDSRTLLAGLDYCDIECKCFTMENSTISCADRNIPMQLAQKLGMDYIFIKQDRNRFNRKKHKEFMEFNSGYVVDQDINYYSYGQYDKLLEFNDDKKMVVLRSGLWEAVVAWYLYGNKLSDDLELRYSDILARGGVLRKDIDKCVSLKKYFDYVDKNPEKGITAVDRFLWEQREGAWLSDIEGSYNIYDKIESIQPLNSAYLIWLLLQFDFDDRIVKKHQEKLIKYLSSDLSEIPYDVHKGEKAVVRKLRNGVEKYIKLFCKCGLTYANYFIMDKVVRCFQDYSHR